jgi:hypothetical protein
MKNLSFSFLFVVSMACAPGVQTLAYAPQPERVHAPKEELKALILSNTVQGCISEPTIDDMTMVVQFVCKGLSVNAGNVVLRFDRIASIDLQQQGDWYRVRVHHTAGLEDFVWDSKSADDAKHIDDAITALRKRG